MSIYCKIDGGLVVNRALFDGPLPEDWPNPETWVASEEAQIGWGYAGSLFIAPLAPPEPEPQPITAEVVSAEAQRRINTVGRDALANNILMGVPVPPDVAALCRAIRSRGEEIAVMTPIPRDFAADSRWP
jgi:hypothetical protein